MGLCATYTRGESTSTRQRMASFSRRTRDHRILPAPPFTRRSANPTTTGSQTCSRQPQPEKGRLRLGTALSERRIPGSFRSLAPRDGAGFPGWRSRRQPGDPAPAIERTRGRPRRRGRAARRGARRRGVAPRVDVGSGGQTACRDGASDTSARNHEATRRFRRSGPIAVLGQIRDALLAGTPP